MKGRPNSQGRHKQRTAAEIGWVEPPGIIRNHQDSRLGSDALGNALQANVCCALLHMRHALLQRREEAMVDRKDWFISE
eukprot:1158867-Pelagomonas_calceolata.AAC.23